MNNTLDKKNKTWYNIVINVVMDVIILLLFYLIVLYIIIAPVNISGNSMYPTMENGEIVATARIRPSSYKKDDIVIISTKIRGEEVDIIKRIIATEGDEIAFVKDGDIAKLYFKTDGGWIEKTESYVNEPMKYSLYDFLAVRNYVYSDESRITQGLVIDEDCVFVMGDNRNGSIDSRELGQFRVDEIKTKMLFNVTDNPFYNFIFSNIYPFFKGDSQ